LGYSGAIDVVLGRMRAAEMGYVACPIGRGFAAAGRLGYDIKTVI
jgi:hypothetical protein